MAEEIAKQAALAATVLKTRTNDDRTSALKVIHDALRDSKDTILEANKKDMALAQEANYSDSLIKRLDLGKPEKYDTMLQGILDVGAQEDPLGKITLARHLDDGMDLYKVTTGIGVLLVIFEARPEVIANISAIAIKSGNAAILKGGKESLHTFTAMSEVVKKALAKTKVPQEALQLVSTREQVGDLLKQDQYIDLVVPRGSNALVRNIKDNTRIPVMGHADGICSVYVHDDADPEMATRIVVDSKTDYPAACNAAETLLVNEKIVGTTLIKILNALVGAGVECKLEPSLLEKVKQVDSSLSLSSATEQDFSTEFLSLTIAVKSVATVEEAITHINAHGSHHTDAIVTADDHTAMTFVKGVDSADVFVRAATRFADGGRFGLGAEVGIATGKIHATGPVGLEGLTIYKYVIMGSGQCAGDYGIGEGKKKFKHKEFVPSSTDFF